MRRDNTGYKVYFTPEDPGVFTTVPAEMPLITASPGKAGSSSIFSCRLVLNFKPREKPREKARNSFFDLIRENSVVDIPDRYLRNMAAGLAGVVPGLGGLAGDPGPHRHPEGRPLLLYPAPGLRRPDPRQVPPEHQRPSGYARSFQILLGEGGFTAVFCV